MISASTSNRSLATFGWAFFAGSVILNVMLFPIRGQGAIVLSAKGEAKVKIVLAHNAARSEKTAAEELQTYLRRMTSAVFQVVDENDTPASAPAIWVGPTRHALAMKIVPVEPEAWVIRSAEGQLVLCGGRPRGTLYAVYHFLEDHLGVRWWNPQEDFVPQRPDLVVGVIERKGRPALGRRCMNMGYETPHDGGAFIVRSRMNSSGSSGPAIDPKYGCDDGFLVGSRPWGAHTFNIFVSGREALIKEHPEYFAVRNGKRVTDTLDLMNPGLRDYIAQRLHAMVQTDRVDARKAGRNRPLVYNLSKEDEPNVYSETPENVAMRAREGSESGVLLDFINDQARRVRAVDPEVWIETLAYQNTEDSPRTLKPADNVIITLCDTESILTVPIADSRNRDFADKISAWSKKSKHLRVWDYGYCFMPEGWEYPVPTEQTYRPDYQFFLQHNVKGIFIQFENDVLGDMADLKRWLIAKLMEDPTQDANHLITDFTEGYYGPAGKYIREYRDVLARAAADKPPGYMLLCACEHTTLHYLDTAFIVHAKGIFGKAERECRDDPLLLRRVHHARAALDAAELARSSLLRRRWQLERGDVRDFPLNPKVAADRLKKTLFEQAAQRTGKADAPAYQSIAARVDLYAQIRPTWSLPEQFRTVRADRLQEYAPPCIPRVVAPAEVVADGDSECGLAIRHPWTDPVTPEAAILTAGICSMQALPTRIICAEGPVLRRKDLKGPGYRWYRILNKVTIHNDSKFYLAMPTGWNIQFSCDTPDSFRDPGHYDAWARLKFTSPASSALDQAMAGMIYLERVLFVKNKASDTRGHDRAPH